MRRSQAGVTLIEMVAVLAIGGILTAMAVPSFSEMREGYRLRAATYNVFAALQRARSEAVKKNNNYRVRVMTSTTYRIHDDLDSDGGDPESGEPWTIRSIANDSPGVTMSANVQSWNGTGWEGAASITFAPDGTTGGAADVARKGEITLTSSNGEHRKIYVAASGRIHIE